MWPENLVLERLVVRRLAYEESFQESRFALKYPKGELKMNTYIMRDVVLC